tara:strand:+ start:29531 stop:30664 length:1134 start_codon:yes stop_codon:yes gene_type:complete
MTKFLKLDRPIMSNFDIALGDNIQTVKTGIIPLLYRLFLYKKLGFLKILLDGLFRNNSRPFIEGNIYRKQIDYPKIFKFPIIAKPYIGYKMLQAHLVFELLEDTTGDYLKRGEDLTLLIYNGSLSPDILMTLIPRSFPRVYIENGFFPNTLQIDSHGINAANSLPRDPYFYLERPAYAQKDLPKTIQSRKTKIGYESVAVGSGFVFFAFQIPSDMQVRVHSHWIKSTLQFLDIIIEVAKKLPEQNFVIKEHPSFKQSVIGKRNLPVNILFANGNVTSELIKNARCVVTLNSTVGIEGLLFNKPVITLADACYNIEGLVRNVSDTQSLIYALSDRKWKQNKKLQTQFIGYLWNEYLVHGYYNNLPSNLSEVLKNLSNK